MAADAQLGVIADWALGRTPAAGPLILGITGAVAAGKSTFAADLAQALAGSRPRVELVCSDGFLHSNQTLTGLDLLNRKGFPETFDSDAQVRALTEIRTGAAVFPAHSHVTYDIDPALSRTLSGVDVLIIEGLNLRRDTAPVDGLIYIDESLSVDLSSTDLRNRLKTSDRNLIEPDQIPSHTLEIITNLGLYQ